MCLEPIVNWKLIIIVHSVQNNIIDHYPDFDMSTCTVNYKLIKLAINWINLNDNMYIERF